MEINTDILRSENKVYEQGFESTTKLNFFMLAKVEWPHFVFFSALYNFFLKFSKVLQFFSQTQRFANIKVHLRDFRHNCCHEIRVFLEIFCEENVFPSLSGDLFEDFVVLWNLRDLPK